MQYKDMSRFALAGLFAVSGLAWTPSAFALCQTITECAYIVNGFSDSPTGVSYTPGDEPQSAITRTASKTPPPPRRISDPESVRKIFVELRESNRRQVELLEQLVQIRSQDPDFKNNRLLRIAAEEGFDIGLIDDGRIARELTGKQPPRPGPRVVPPDTQTPSTGK